MQIKRGIIKCQRGLEEGCVVGDAGILFRSNIY